MYPASHMFALMTSFMLVRAYHCGITMLSQSKEGRSQKDHRVSVLAPCQRQRTVRKNQNDKRSRMHSVACPLGAQSFSDRSGQGECGSTAQRVLAGRAILHPLPQPASEDQPPSCLSAPHPILWGDRSRSQPRRAWNGSFAMHDQPAFVKAYPRPEFFRREGSSAPFHTQLSNGSRFLPHTIYDR
jgi:hypothetical protein